jgi:hypothetical protein
MTAQQNTQPAEQHDEVGEIVRLDDHGLAILKTKRDGRAYPFTFDKIRAYKGQPPKDIGLRLGAQVKFVADNDKIKDVEILSSEI